MYFKLFLFGLGVHLILLYSVFDIYFISPIVKNARSHPISGNDAPAKRLVVFSAGLFCFNWIIIPFKCVI
jgi:phosphatidylinositol glycan class N